MQKLWIVLVLAAGTAHASDTIDLSGTWQFGRSRGTIGEETIRLPGSVQEQDLGDPISLDTPWTGNIVDRSFFTEERYEKYRQPGNFKVPFWLQSKTHHVGEAWYRRMVDIPPSWSKKRVVLYLERPHWETRVWVDGQEAGMRNSLSTPHEYELTALLRPGKQTLTICVDNRIKDINVGPNSHSVSDHTQSNWNGLVGKLRLVATDPVWIEDVQIYPDIGRNVAKTRIRVGQRNRQGLDATVVATVSDARGETVGSVSWNLSLGEKNDVEGLVELGDRKALWDEFHPVLHRIRVQVTAGSCSDEREFRFGMREVRTRGAEITLNGARIFLRGTLECAIFPRTGYPPTDVAEWKRIIGTCKAYGLNHMRFHSWCPPEAAFLAADELGFYFHVECASWANQGATVGDGKPIDRWLYEEAKRILNAYGNHPSFVTMAYGNEPAGKNHKRWLGDWVNHWKARDSRRLYTSAAGWPAIPENQYHNIPQPRIHQWGAGLESRINARPPETATDYRDIVRQYDVPIVGHEIGQWCIYPNFEEIEKYTGVLKPRNFEIFRDFLQDAGMGHQARDFLMASGKLQALCYKEEIESALRTPGFGGFQLLDLHDFPGQGTALVGVVDPFWDPKPTITPEEFRRFCSETVPLARLEKRVWTSDEVFRAKVELAHFGAAQLGGAEILWKVADSKGREIGSGTWKRSVEQGSLSTIGSVEQPLGQVACPAEISLAINIRGTSFANEWSSWVYRPWTGAPPEGPPSLIRRLDEETEARLEAGDRAWLMADPRTVHTDVRLGFSSIFWNTAWTRGQAPHSLGILCDPKHPAFSEFPTEFHSNWQWWELVSRAATMDLDHLPGEIRPIVQVVPDWFHPKRLGLVFEARVGKGKLLVTSIDLESDLQHRPVARQMRVSLARYLSSSQFQPDVTVSADQVRALFKPLSVLQKLGATITADSEQKGYEAELAIDGDPRTMWHTAWGEREKPLPHHLVIDLGSEQTIVGVTVLPRSDMPNGRIANYTVEIDERTAHRGTWENNAKLKKVTFAPLKGRLVRILAESEVQGRAWASIAEVDVLIE